MSYIDQLFNPNAVAVFGVSERADSIGGMVYRNILAGDFKGHVYAINPKHEEVAGRPCYKDLDALDRHLDLALIAVPANQVVGVLDQCGNYGVQVAIVYSAGFGEQGDQGAALQERVVEAAQRTRIRLLGPNYPGVIRPEHGFNASVGHDMPRCGNVALVAQSGAICTAMTDWAEGRQFGLSAVVSMGAAADVDFGDVLDFLAVDIHTQCILLYVEGIRNARRFVSGLRAAARLKPVVVYKAGQHAAGARAFRSHTGAFVGSQDVFPAVTERTGIVQVEHLEELFDAAQVFGTGRRLAGERIAIITNGGGPGVLAADHAQELGLTLATLSEHTIQTMEQALPNYWAPGNPVDLIGDASPERYRVAVDACLADSAVDGVLVIFAPLGFGESTQTAQQVIEAARQTDKPVLVSWMGTNRVAEAQALFSENRIPHFVSPETAITAFSFLARHLRNQRFLMQFPVPLSDHEPSDPTGARLIIQGVMADGRRSLGITEAKAVLAAFRIPTMPATRACSPNDALVAAASVGLPVVLKIDSPDLENKSDVDGVVLNVDDAQSVRRTYTEIVERAQRLRPDIRINGVTVEHMVSKRAARELMIGVNRDSVFGPIISFGAGGTEVDLLEDRALGLPPLNTLIIQTMIGHTRVARRMEARQQIPSMNRDALTSILLRVSELVCEVPEIISLEINPLIGNDQEVIAVDARIQVDYVPPQQRTYGHMAIHPYPINLIERVPLPDGKDLVIRPIRPEDADLVQEFVRGLSEQTRYYRYMQPLKELSPQMLVRFTHIDYDREFALIGMSEHEGKEAVVGISRYFSRPGGESCEFAIVVSDRWRNRGIGGRLMRSLMANARRRGFRIMEGEVLAVNTRMLALMKSLGFRSKGSPEDAAIKLVTKIL
jgi:acetyltransferase